MQNSQYDLCLSTLRRLREARILDQLVLIGSWCLVLYKRYFEGVGAVYPVKTRDMDFVVPPTAAFRNRISVPDLLRDLGFVAGFRGEQGYMFLQHPELLIEFLVPERGRGCAAVKDLPDLGMNAQPLRFLDVALQKTIRLHFDDIPVTVPHPAAFALHKLLVAGRRKSAAKRKRDIDSALDVLALIEKKGEIAELQAVMAHFPPSWKKTVLKALRETQRLALAERLGR